jgi:hypothetical protein
MKSGNQHQHEAAEGKKYNAGIEAPGPTKIEKKPGCKDFQQQAHSQKANGLQPAYASQCQA